MPRTESNLFANNSQNRKFYYRNGLPGRTSFPDRHSAIWLYYNDHWRHYFPNLPSRSVFAKQCANLIILKQMIQRLLYPADDVHHITDGFPIIVCRNCRASGCKIFRGENEAAWGYCATKKEYYF